MESKDIQDLLDSLVAEYSDRVGRGEAPDRDALLAQVPEDQRASLERCFRVVDLGLASPAIDPASLAPGSRLGSFRIERVLGKGGMAVVYLAEEEELKRRVALKVLRPGLSVDARHVDRFRREAMAVAKIQHPNILQIYSVGEDRGVSFIAMEYVEGPSLAQVLDTLEDIPTARAEDFCRSAGLEPVPGISYEHIVSGALSAVARALVVTHELGIVHRDLKPSNILFHRDGRPVIADFGLAREEGDPALTATGEAIGTPYYMSPEQVARSQASVDQRSDVYSLGVTLYECLTGERPFTGETVLEVFDAIRAQTPVPVRVRAPRCSRGAEAVVRRAMSREPGDRYASAMELAVDLEALAHGSSTRAAADEGGPVRRVFSALHQARSPGGFEYRSRATLLGMPLVHVALGRSRPGGPIRRARGWLAIGAIASGGIACGNVAVGVVSLGVVSIGIASLGAAVAVGGLALAGGCGIGGFAFGGCAVGYAALGGYAAGVYAMGGSVDAVHGISAMGEDPVAVEWFKSHFPRVYDWYYELSRRGR